LASAFNQLGQYTSIPGRRGYCYAELAIHVESAIKRQPACSICVCRDVFSYVDNEFKMLQLLSSYGPLTVGVDASNWINYQGGIIQYHCGEMPRNHAVQIVGYNLTGL